MSKNLTRVGLDDTVLSSAIFDTSDGFFPLADVPDKVWKSGPAGIRRRKERRPTLRM